VRAAQAAADAVLLAEARVTAMRSELGPQLISAPTAVRDSAGAPLEDAAGAAGVGGQLAAGDAGQAAVLLQPLMERQRSVAAALAGCRAVAEAAAAELRALRGEEAAVRRSDLGCRGSWW
jgi:hypothetical protein